VRASLPFFNGDLIMSLTNARHVVLGSLTNTHVDPYNPLGLPQFTIRCKFTQGHTPSCSSEWDHGWDNIVQVDPVENVWDITVNTDNWGDDRDGAIYAQHELLEVLGANTTGVTSMGYCFGYCEKLTSIALFDTRSVTKMCYMLARCSSLTSIPLFDTHNVTDFSYMCFGYSWSGWLPITHVPLFDTSSATDVTYMFGGAKNVESGALALYQQMSTQANPPSNHSRTFEGCGSNTVTGAAELAQIPTDWGGTSTEEVIIE
jgi:hypothetical protein